MKVHQFDSTGEAYDASQTSDEISHGDVLVVSSEKVVAVLDHAWPVAVTSFAGNFHVVNGTNLTTPHYFQKHGLGDSYSHAVVVAADAGFEVAP